jgi:hypothetical protein
MKIRDAVKLFAWCVPLAVLCWIRYTASGEKAFDYAARVLYGMAMGTRETKGTQPGADRMGAN